MATGGLGLALQRTQLSAHFAQQVRQAVQVGFRRTQPTLSLLLPAPVLQDSGSIFNDAASILRTSVQDGVDLTLGDDDVLLPPHPDIRKQFLDIEQPTRCTVHRVLAVPTSEQRAGNGHIVELHRKLSRGVVDREGDLCPAEGCPCRCPGKDDVVHLLGANSTRCLRTQYPRNSVHNVRLTAAVGANHDGHPRFHL